MNTATAREEKRAAFNEQMNAWVSRQGIWFQLRHAAEGQSLLSRLWRLAMRAGLLLLIVAGIAWYVLSKRVESEGFRTDLEERLAETIGISECKIKGVSKKRDQLSIGSLTMDGGDSAFFHHISARSIKLGMNTIDGLVGTWTSKAITMDSLDCELRAGAGDEAAASQAYQSLFPKLKNFDFQFIQVDQARVHWGYTENTYGEINNSRLVAARQDGGWRLEFTGGYFSQNWLRKMPIQSIVIRCDQKGVRIEKAELRAGSGTLSFSGDFSSGGKPELDGTIQFKSVKLHDLLESKYHDWVSGQVSGAGKIKGSPNSLDGILMDVDVLLADGDEIVLRDNFAALSALTVVDLYNSYRKVSFDEGRFNLKSGRGVLNLSGIDLKAGDLIEMKGQLDVRPPSNAEVASALNIDKEDQVQEILDEQWRLEIQDTRAKQGEKITLQGAGAANKNRATEEKNPKQQEAYKLLSKAVLTEKKTLRFAGKVKLGLKNDAFSQSQELTKAYPVDETTNRIWIDTSLDGHLQALTLELAQKLYKLGRDTE